MTISLAILAPDTKTAGSLVSRYSRYFDDVVIQLAPECKDFAKARNKMSKKVKTDFYLWLDTDDSLKNPERLPELLQIMERDGLDALFLPYEYGYNEQKEVIALHWRERLIRTSHPFEWKGVVHETLISENSPRMAQNDAVVVSHAYRDHEATMNSVLRNHHIMEEAVKKGDEDPRLLYYLGRSYFMLERYQESAQTLLIYTDKSGWDEQKYDAWLKIGDALLLMDEYEKSINSNLEAVKLYPNWPDAYLKLGDLYLHLEQPARAIQWLKTGLTKPQPQTLEIIDPTLYTYRPLISLALCYFGMADIKNAKKYIDEAAKFSPKTKMFKSTYKSITEAWIEEQTIKSAAWLGKYVKEKGKLKEYIDGLPGFIKNDLRLRPLRVAAYPASKWPKKSIVFYCGEQWEEWGPDTIKQGMGGSEEAVVYLSRELARLGWQVTVYNQRVEEIEEERVRYKPWETFNPEDEFDVFVAWRNPWLADKLKIKARLKCVDMHDTPIGHQAFPDKALKTVDKIFLKSKFQQKLGNIPDSKAVLIPNGIEPKQFEHKVRREMNKVIYASSADRGLDDLVRKVWPKVLEEVPDAQLVWAYGWDSYDAMHKGSTEHAKWKWELKRDMVNIGAKDLGRLSHEDLAKEFLSSNIWAYPTYFDEISCITAMKAQVAECKVVTTGKAALQETVIEKEKYNPDLEYFTKRLIMALKEPRDEKKLDQVKQQVIKRYAWANIAKVWDKEVK